MKKRICRCQRPVKAHFEEVVDATAPYKVGVSECYQDTSSLTNCNAGSYHVQPAITSPTGNVASLSVVAGVITVTPVATNEIRSTDTYILTPTVEPGSTAITWAESGDAVSKGYTK